MKHTSLLSILLVSIFSLFQFCQPDKPNLHSKKIVFDSTALKMLNDMDKPPSIKIESVQIPESLQVPDSVAHKNEVRGLTIKQNTIDTLKQQNLLHFDENPPLCVLTPDRKILELYFGGNTIDGVEFQTNKEIKTLNGLKLTAACFGKARLERELKGSWRDNHGNIRVHHTRYSPFQFYNIQTVSIQGEEALFRYILKKHPR